MTILCQKQVSKIRLILIDLLDSYNLSYFTNFAQIKVVIDLFHNWSQQGIDVQISFFKLTPYLWPILLQIDISRYPIALAWS